MAVDPETLYRRFGPMVLRRCRQLLRDEDHAADAMHDVFVEICRRRDTLDDRGLSSLLYRTATHVCLNRLRSQRRRPEDGDDGLLDRIAAAHEPAGEVVARQVLDRLFGRAPASSRTIAVLHLLDGLTLDEVASTMGMSVSGVRKRLRSLRADLVELEAMEVTR
ncbi:MAG: sigma-70 family RNA polymerase sigma factor [bacterium]